MAALSPSLWFAERAIFGLLEAAPAPPGRLYLDVGRLEGARPWTMPAGCATCCARRGTSRASSSATWRTAGAGTRKRPGAGASGPRCRFFFLLPGNPCTTSTTAGTAPRSAGRWPWTSSGITARGSWSSPPRWAPTASGSTAGCTRSWPTTSTRGGSSSSSWTTCPSETWNADHLHPGARAWRFLQYDQYLVNEVLPFTASRNSNPVRDRHRREPRRLLRGLPRLPASAPGEPDPRDERDLRHQAAHRRLLGRTTSTPAIPPTSSGTSTIPAGWRRSAGRTSSSPSAATIRPTQTTRACRPPSGARGSATPCGSGTVGRTIGRTGRQMVRRYIGGHD